MLKRLLLIGLAVFAVTLSVFMPVFAFAAEVAAKVGEINLAPATQGHDNLFVALLALAALSVYGFMSKFSWFNKLVTKEQYMKLVEPLLDNAVAYGVGKLKDANWLRIETKNEAVANAVQYALDHGGGLLEKFGVTEELLVQKIEAKLVANGWDTKPGKWVEGPTPEPPKEGT